MKEQAQPDSGNPKQYVRNIVQASVALIILTAALWIGWWPDLAAVPAATGSTGYFNEGQSSTQLTDDRMLDQLGQETSYQNIKPLSRGSQLPISEDTVITSASSEVRSSETEQVTTTPSTSTASDQTISTQTRQTSEKSPESAATKQVQVSDITGEPFFGIEPVIFAQWQFPLKVEPHTPSQGVFGAGRTSTRLHAGIDSSLQKIKMRLNNTFPIHQIVCL